MSTTSYTASSVNKDSNEPLFKLVLLRDILKVNSPPASCWSTEEPQDPIAKYKQEGERQLRFASCSGLDTSYIQQAFIYATRTPGLWYASLVVGPGTSLANKCYILTCPHSLDSTDSSASGEAHYHQPWSSFSACWAPLPPGALSTLNHPETQLRQACKYLVFDHNLHPNALLWASTDFIGLYLFWRTSIRPICTVQTILVRDRLYERTAAELPTATISFTTNDWFITPR